MKAALFISLSSDASSLYTSTHILRSFSNEGFAQSLLKSYAISVSEASCNCYNNPGNKAYLHFYATFPKTPAKLSKALMNCSSELGLQLGPLLFCLNC